MTVSERIDRLFWAALTSLAVFALFLFLTQPGYAQATGGAGSFTCSAGRASGELYDSGMRCPTTLTFSNVFSFLVCNFEQLSSDLMGNLYCGVVYRLTPIVTGVVTLAVTFFGVGFTVGVIPATAREYQKFLIKMAFVIAFATQAEYMIGIAYRFFVEGAREGIAIALSGLYQDTTTTGADVYGHLDHFLSTAIGYATAYVGLTEFEASNACKDAVFAAIAIMAVAFPPLFYLSLAIIFRVAVTFFRAVFGYIYAIIGIAFLITVSPIFLSFALFQQTRDKFDKWLGYLASFALQMVLVFAFLTFVVSINVSHITSSFVGIVMPTEETHVSTSVTLPWKYCTICQFRVVNSETGSEITGDYKNFLGKGQLQCKDDPPKPITVLTMAAPPDKNATGAQKELLNALLKFAAAGGISLLVLAFLVDGLLGMIPQLAQYLAGGMGGYYAPQLGGGEGMGGGGRAVARAPGEGLISSFGRGFTSGFTYGPDNKGGTSIERTATGVKQGFERMLFGAGEGTSEAAKERDPGLIGTMRNYLINPHGDRQE
jgi:hypothetical protein